MLLEKWVNKISTKVIIFSNTNKSILHADEVNCNALLIFLSILLLDFSLRVLRQKKAKKKISPKLSDFPVGVWVGIVIKVFIVWILKLLKS